MTADPDIFMWAMVLLLVFMIPALLRLILGKTLADRAVALDTINTLVVASMIVGGAAFSEPIYIDVAIVYALLSFITTLYMAKFMEGGVEA